MIIEDLKKRIKELEKQDRDDEYETRARPYLSNLRKNSNKK